ncbi:uncharacterized protein YbjQ (UPF0145 family) [Rubricella aquisinus]|uniref:UPF0145 protein FHS89_002654 n=1 Tax=Rubricella aquisinus TaxID=2028108 RepID=A0A840WRF7_9RHOB|nr:YbjQ family protein [Rubricella aquisinus]MBB5516623.1 uncharacterized protein YbjQ (UPF0145 family) [Rubricella aquisinus]
MTMSNIDRALVVTTATIPGREVVTTLGIARGSSIRTKHVGTDIVAALRSLVGGEVKGYSAMMGAAREQAFDRMCAEAEALGADAIVEVRFATAMVMQGASEVLAYGTAVRLNPR